MNILVTGGAGYIGSHTVVELINQNHTVIVDDLSNSSEEVINRIERITGKRPELHTFNLENREELEKVFAANNFDAVIHFAGLKAVGESVANPLHYYRTNIDSTLTLLETMEKFGVKKLVFSSSATVYGSAEVPYTENSPVGQGITNPYGQTKYMIEQIIRDYSVAHPDFSATILRYFNPIGAHESGLIGEHPNNTPNNLMPYITQVATGTRNKLSVFGDDYDTVDGTGVRDYIHVVDLARGHLIALEQSQLGATAYNLGTGEGVSVLQLVHAFENASGQTIAYEVVDRRPGDLPIYYADSKKALDELGWKPEKSLEDACEDSWRWQSRNPKGYIE